LYYWIFSFSADYTYSRGVLLPYQPNPTGPPVGQFTVNRGNIETNIRRVTLYPNVYNALSMRFGNSAEELDTASWHPYDEVFSWKLPLNFEHAEVFGEFISESGLSHRTSACIAYGEPALWIKTFTYEPTLRLIGTIPASDGGFFHFGSTNADGCIVVKHDGGGGIDWQRMLHHSDYSPVHENYAADVVETEDGGCLVFTRKGGLLRLDDIGDLLWAKRIDDFHGYSAVGSSNGDIFLLERIGTTVLF
jgi:hypothetical protein